MTKRKLVLAFCVLGFISQAIAEKKITSNCQVNSYKDLVACLERVSIEMKISEQQRSTSQGLESVARQWQNPELEVESAAQGADKSETSAKLFFTVSLAGKKTALVKEAQSEANKVTEQVNIEIQKQRLSLMLSLYRLAHLKNEIAIEDESIETFSKIVKQFQKRPVLAPEQDVSLSVFKMALADHQLQITKLKNESEKELVSIINQSGLERSIILKNLPSRKLDWPAVAIASNLEDTSAYKMALSELKVAQSQKAKADGEVWSDIKIGPAVKTTKDNNDTTTYVGIGLSMPLPLLNQNQASRSYQSQKMIEAELNMEKVKRSTISARSELRQSYEQTIQSLKNTTELNLASAKHEELERQFFKGLISSSLVIEVHRQLIELEQRKNSSELEALTYLGELLIIDQKFDGVIL